MKIETDRAEILSGVRWGETLGSPLTLAVINRDWENWCEKMSQDPQYRDESSAVTRPRPGHADLAGGGQRRLVVLLGGQRLGAGERVLGGLRLGYRQIVGQSVLKAKP